MARIILFVLMVFAFSSCSKDDDSDLNKNELTGKWQLIEQYSDPGDGSGDFQSVDSEKTIEFFRDGNVVSNGSLCYMSSDVGAKSVGVFDVGTKTISSKLCSSFEYKITYKLVDGNLQLWYPCIEGCAQKYKKIASN